MVLPLDQCVVIYHVPDHLPSDAGGSSLATSYVAAETLGHNFSQAGTYQLRYLAAKPVLEDKPSGGEGENAVEDVTDDDQDVKDTALQGQGVPYTLGAVEYYSVTTGDEVCQQVLVSLEPLSRRFCLGQDLRLLLHLPASPYLLANPRAGVVGILPAPLGAAWGGEAHGGGRGSLDLAWAAGDLHHFPVVNAVSCAPPCRGEGEASGGLGREGGDDDVDDFDASEQTCSACFKRVCSDGLGECWGDIEVRLVGSMEYGGGGTAAAAAAAGGGGGGIGEGDVTGLVAPTVEGVFRACFYLSVEDFRWVSR